MMLTVKDVAARWNVSPGLIYKLVEAGRLECHRIGKAIRFAEEHLTAFLTASTEPAPPKQSFSHLDL